MSKREQNRHDKRALIVDAARKLMRSRKMAGFSMRQLAEVAGVSSATPYNLFGSKQGVIAAVMDTDLSDFKERLLADNKDSIEVFFHLVTVTVSLFGEEPNYHKTGALAVHQETDESIKSSFGQPRLEMMRNLIYRAIQQGQINHQINADSLSISLNMQFYSWIQAWANDRISLEDLELRGHYSFALSLAGVATDASRGELTARLLDLQSRLPENWASQTHTIKTGT